DIPVVPRKALLKVPAQPRRPFLARKREARTQDGLRSLDPSPRGFQSNPGEAPNAPSRHHSNTLDLRDLEQTQRFLTVQQIRNQDEDQRGRTSLLGTNVSHPE